MTREEAIKELKTEYLGDNEAIREAIYMAIEALQEPRAAVAKRTCKSRMRRCAFRQNTAPRVTGGRHAELCKMEYKQ